MEVAARSTADAPRQDAVAGPASHSLFHLAAAAAMAWDAGYGDLKCRCSLTHFTRGKNIPIHQSGQ